MSESILIIKLGALGDIFLALESFQSIRAHHPGASITLLTRPAFVSLAQMMPWFNTISSDSGVKFWQLPSCWRFARQLRRASFTRVYDLQGNDRARFYQRLGGWREPAQWVPASLTEKAVRRRGLPVMAVPARHRLMLEAAGVQWAGPPELSWLGAPLTGLEIPARFVLFIPGCAPTRLYKRWPPERYAELGRRLLAQGLTPVLIGAKADAEAIAAIRSQLPEALDLCGRTSLPQLATLARQAAGVVGNDTGPVHLAALTGAPTLVLMSGHSDPVRMKPPGENASCWQVQNLTELTVDAVWEQLRLRQPPH